MLDRHCTATYTPSAVSRSACCVVGRSAGGGSRRSAWRKRLLCNRLWRWFMQRLLVPLSFLALEGFCSDRRRRPPRGLCPLTATVAWRRAAATGRGAAPPPPEGPRHSHRPSNLVTHAALPAKDDAAHTAVQRLRSRDDRWDATKRALIMCQGFLLGVAALVAGPAFTDPLLAVICVVAVCLLCVHTM